MERMLIHYNDGVVIPEYKSYFVKLYDIKQPGDINMSICLVLFGE